MDFENNVLLRREDESPYQYHRRLVYGKLEDKTLADYDYSELSGYVYGQEFSTDVARRMMYGSKRTLDIAETWYKEVCTEGAPAEIRQDIRLQMFELKKERQRLFDERTALNAVVRQRARQEELNSILVEAVRSGSLPALNYERNYIKPSKHDLIVSLNDIHYGADINNSWNVYNSDVCREMFKRYLDRIIDIAETHNAENCYITELGDAISGNIHISIQLANKENVVEQIKGVSELIAEFMSELSCHFSNVAFISVAGNHSRLGKKQDVKSDERLDDLIDWYLRARLREFENISFECADKIDTTMSLIDIRGKTYCCVHGDYDDTPTKIASTRSFAQRPIYAILCGHKHHNSIKDINGIKLIMSGSFMGMDDYCIKNRIYGKPEQMVCVCSEDGVECFYSIPLN